jgi:hypothetical protein
LYGRSEIGCLENGQCTIRGLALFGSSRHYSKQMAVLPDPQHAAACHQPAHLDLQSSPGKDYLLQIHAGDFQGHQYVLGHFNRNNNKKAAYYV